MFIIIDNKRINFDLIKSYSTIKGHDAKHQPTYSILLKDFNGITEEHLFNSEEERDDIIKILDKKLLK